MSKIKPREQAAAFVGSLLSIEKNRGKMAALRRGLSPSTVISAWPVVAGLGGKIGHPGESVHIDVAALFATHPQLSKARNFGETCYEIAIAHSPEKLISESHERRFRRLIASDQCSELVRQLRSWIRLAASKSIGVNYESLFADLLRWRWYAEDIRVQWARSFWHSGSVTLNTPPSNTTTQVAAS